MSIFKKRNASMVDDLLSALSADSISVSDILRKMRIIMHRLKQTDFEARIMQELNGYDGPVPEYRRIQGRILAQLPGGTVPAPIADPEEEKNLSTVPLKWSMKVIERAAGKDPMQELSFPLPGDVQDNLMRRSSLGVRVPFVVVFSALALDSVIEYVKEVLLDMALTLEDMGIKGIGMKFTRYEINLAKEIHDFAIGVAASVVASHITGG